MARSSLATAGGECGNLRQGDGFDDGSLASLGVAADGQEGSSWSREDAVGDSREGPGADRLPGVAGLVEAVDSARGAAEVEPAVDREGGRAEPFGPPAAGEVGALRPRPG